MIHYLDDEQLPIDNGERYKSMQNINNNDSYYIAIKKISEVGLYLTGLYVYHSLFNYGIKLIF